MSEYLISLDQGTTSTRAILYDQRGQKLAVASEQIKSYFPHDGWVEQDPKQILASAQRVMQQVLQQSKISANQVTGLGITNQRETTLVWDRQTGECVYPAIVWQDKRTTIICDALRQRPESNTIQQKTGLLLDPYFSATKVNWILHSIPGVRERAEKGELCFGTVDSFLMWHLAKDHPHVTDVTNASRTLLFNIHDLDWDKGLLDLFQIPEIMLPEVKPNCAAFGILESTILGAELPILAVIGDQQSASIGQGCIFNQQLKATYGTGCFLLLNTGAECVLSQNKLLSTIAYQVKDNLSYALEGSIFIAGALFKWMKESLALFKDEGEIEEIILNLDTPDELFFVPSLSGLGAPFWDPKAKGAIFGLTQDTHLGHIIKAGLQGVCYQTRDLIESLNKDCNSPVQSLKVDGGMTINAGFLQALSSCLHLDVHVSSCSEATAFGVFLLSGVQCGLFSDLEHATQLCQTAKVYQSHHTAEQATHHYQQWLQHVEKVKV
tara:strand:+ start:52334 stop:53815 length:1482 start_codon:yes stop_codon:yes gene_type:complete